MPGVGWSDPVSPVRPHEGSGVFPVPLMRWSRSAISARTSLCPGCEGSRHSPVPHPAWAAKLFQTCPGLKAGKLLLHTWTSELSHLGGVVTLDMLGNGSPRIWAPINVVPCIRVGAVGSFWRGLIKPKVPDGGQEPWALSGTRCVQTRMTQELRSTQQPNQQTLLQPHQ